MLVKSIKVHEGLLNEKEKQSMNKLKLLEAKSVREDLSEAESNVMFSLKEALLDQEQRIAEANIRLEHILNILITEIRRAESILRQQFLKKSFVRDLNNFGLAIAPIFKGGYDTLRELQD